MKRSPLDTRSIRTALPLDAPPSRRTIRSLARETNGSETNVAPARPWQPTRQGRGGSCNPASAMCFRIWFARDLPPQRQRFTSRSVSGETERGCRSSAFGLFCPTTRSKLHPNGTEACFQSVVPNINELVLLVHTRKENFLGYSPRVRFLAGST